MNTKDMRLEERMKLYYEQPFNYKLPMRMPVIIRLDGRCFHNFTKKMDRPVDKLFQSNMMQLTKYLCEEITGAVFAYSQSDEISILLHNYKKLVSQAWFCNEVQKIVSISAGMASSFFTKLYDKWAIFDSRVFVIPESEVCNYFIWRQQDATRNSINMHAQSMFSHKQLQNKSCNEMQEMMFKEKKFNWDMVSIPNKRGFSYYKDPEPIISEYDGSTWRGTTMDIEVPIFTQNREYINQFLEIEKE